MRGQLVTFPIDHVTPQSADGETIEENLALSCPVCNGRKWKHTQGIVVESGETAALFNPRTQDWTEHFAWSQQEIGVLVALTDCGRATIARLQMNDPDIVEARQLLAELGLFDEILVTSAS